jgi:hypothetical protein
MMIKKLLALCASGLATVAATAADVPPLKPYEQPPVWTKDLVIYEIATKGFTSPSGPETGNFKSMRERLDHLQKLGITGIWLTGYSKSVGGHFYNIWNQYAVVEPDQLDPSLGTPEEFKAFIDDAHARGIKVFLDVITHGVMPQSSLKQNHPEWFRGGSWGMVDFDWNGGHRDLDEWWIKTFTDYVTQYGVDGYRLDVAISRPDLWKRIRENAFAAGHPITVFIEREPVIPGTTDFMQHSDPIIDLFRGKPNELALNDIPEYYRRKADPYAGTYRVELRYVDGTVLKGTSSGGDGLSVKFDGFTTDREAMSPKVPFGKSEIKLSVGTTGRGAVRDDKGEEVQKWTYARYLANPTQSEFAIVGVGEKLSLYLGPIQSESASVQLSCHDNGWEGTGTGNPYVAQGSRSTFGYSVLFVPKIPIFMSGEEFDAGHHPLPTLSPNLFGGADPGKGRWLYGNQLDWSELKQPKHAAMYADVSRMLQIRKAESAILHAELDSQAEKRIAGVPFTADIAVPKPYIRWANKAAIIVLGNRSTTQDAHAVLNVPLDRIGGQTARYRVTDLWNGGKARVMTPAQLQKLDVTVKRDLVARGGLGLVKVEALD